MLAVLCAQKVECPALATAAEIRPAIKWTAQYVDKDVCVTLQTPYTHMTLQTIDLNNIIVNDFGVLCLSPPCAKLSLDIPHMT